MIISASATFCLYGFVAILVLTLPGSSSDIPLGVTAKSGGPIPTTEELNYAISILDAAGIDISCPCLNNITSIDTPYSGNHNDDGSDGEGIWFYFYNVFLSLLCVSAAATAAGLTMGLLSLEVLDLRIKECTSTCQVEREQARSLIPLVQDHHRLLVSLLLCNAVANEALPIFLDSIVPSYIAVLLSVTMVLFFGEIIPSAIFTGPNKLAVSSRFSPVASFLLFVLAPLAVPLAKILDWALHDNDRDDTNGMQRYDRKELSALVRIQFEERMLAKQARKLDRRRDMVDSTIRIKIREADVGDLATSFSDSRQLRMSDNTMRFDEVNMVQGALGLKDCLVSDVMTPLRRVFALPSDLILTMDQIVDIHREGHSLLPVYLVKESSSNHDESKGNFIGVFRTRHLMVHDSDESRPLSTMPLHKPHCVSPSINMLECIQLLQNGLTSSLSCSAGGHLAFVCHQPSVARDALARGKSIEESGVVGIVTLEDCLEELINSEIFDENDQVENIEYERGLWAINKWKAFVRNNKEKKNSAYPGGKKRSSGYSSIETSDPIRVGDVNDSVSNVV